MKKIIINMKKIILRLNSIIKVLSWKLLYNNSIKININDIFYPKSHITFEKAGNLKIGKNCFFNRNCSINVMNETKIGNNCIFGENVSIYDHNHNFSDKTKLIKKQGYKLKKTIIEDNCWIGSNVVILAGCTIGENSIIGAGCVVSGIIPKNSIVRCDKNNFIEERR